MSKKSKDEKRPLEAVKPFHTPFAALAGAVTPATPAEGASPAPAPKPSPKPGPPPPKRAVVRLERKGHGGKEATVVSHLELAPRLLDEWLGDAKRQLGCGGRVEEGALVLQGDQRDRVVAWLEKRGVAKVVRG